MYNYIHNTCTQTTDTCVSDTCVISGELEPVLTLVMDLPVSEVTTIITVVDDLVKKQLLPGRPQVSQYIYVFTNTYPFSIS